MTVDETRPLGTDLVSTLDDYIRENRVEINDIWASISGGISYPNYNAVVMTAGQTSLIAGTDIDGAGVEMIGLTAGVAVNLTTMMAAIAGATKFIIALDSNITVIQNTGSTTGGTFYLNSPAGDDLVMEPRDMLVVTNIGGDGVVANGYWVELNRKLAVS